jgi:O-antigen ligase
LFDEPLKVNAFLILVAFGSTFILSSQSASAIFAYLFAVAMLAQAPRWLPEFSDPILALSGLLLGYLALTSFWSEPFAAGETFSIVVRVLSTLTFIVAYAECWRAGMLQRWFGMTLVIGGAVAAAAALVSFLITEPEDGRLNGLGQWGAHVIAGLVFGVCLIYSVQAFRENLSGRWRAAAAICGLILVVAIVLTFSRNAWVSVLTGIAVYTAVSWTTSRRQLLVALIIFTSAALVLLALLYFSEAGRNFLLPRGDSFRPLIWSTIFERVWSAAPIFGLGILTPDDVVNGPDVHPHPHSMYLAVLYQGGVVGLGLFLALIAVVIRRLLERLEQPEARVALGVLVIGLLSYLLDGHELVDRIGETWFLFWLPVAISLSLRPRQPAPER